MKSALFLQLASCALAGPLAPHATLEKVAEENSSENETLHIGFGGRHLWARTLENVAEEVSSEHEILHSGFDGGPQHLWYTTLEKVAESSSGENETLHRSPHVPYEKETLHVGNGVNRWQRTLEKVAESFAGENETLRNLHVSSDRETPHVGIPPPCELDRTGENVEKVAKEVSSEREEHQPKAHFLWQNQVENITRSGSWPFLVEFKTPDEMQAAVDAHMDRNAGRLTRLPRLPSGDLAVKRLVPTRWLQYSELEMSCHDGLKGQFPYCHRILPKDNFGITCVQYHDPTTMAVRRDKAGYVCHHPSFANDLTHEMCHLALDFIVDADAAASVQCPPLDILV